MKVGELYYQFTQADFDIISALFGSEATDKLSYDSKYHIYYAAWDGAFADWLSEDADALDLLAANGINTEYDAFQPNSGEGAGDG